MDTEKFNEIIEIGPSIVWEKSISVSEQSKKIECNTDAYKADVPSN
jgi:hypothetical protein